MFDSEARAGLNRVVILRVLNYHIWQPSLIFLEPFLPLQNVKSPYSLKKISLWDTSRWFIGYWYHPFWTCIIGWVWQRIYIIIHIYMITWSSLSFLPSNPFGPCSNYIKAHWGIAWATVRILISVFTKNGLAWKVSVSILEHSVTGNKSVE